MDWIILPSLVALAWTVYISFIHFIHPWCKAISRSIPPLRFVTRTICQLPVPELQSPVFPCPGGSDGSR